MSVTGDDITNFFGDIKTMFSEKKMAIDLCI